MTTYFGFKDFADAVILAEEAGLNVAMVGSHGVGKTVAVKGLPKDRYGVYEKIVSLEDPALAGGIPYKIPYEGGEEGVYESRYTIPHFVIWARETAAAGKVPVLFLDEFNRGDKMVENTYMTMVLGKEIRGHKLPENTLFVSAMNPERDGDMGVSELSDPMIDRFAFVFFEPSVEEWLEFAETPESGIHRTVVNFIKTSPDPAAMLNDFPLTPELVAQFTERIGSTPRTMHSVGRLMTAVESLEGGLSGKYFNTATKLLEGMIGIEKTLAYVESINDEDTRLFTPEEIENAGAAEIERVNGLIESANTQILIESLKVAHKALAEKYAYDAGDEKGRKAAVSALGDTEKGFTRFILAVPVDIAANFFSIANENKTFWTGLISDEDYPYEVIDSLV